MKRFCLLALCLSLVSSVGFAKISARKSKTLKMPKSLSAKNCEYSFINTKEETILSSELNKYYDLGWFSEGYAPVKVGEKWGYIDKMGKPVIDAKYDKVDIFSDGFAPVKIGKKWGYIDKTGKLAIDAKYDDARTFSEGLAAVKRGSLWGFVNDEKTEIIPPNYSSVNDFSEGFASVTLLKTGQAAFIDKVGTVFITFKNGEKPVAFTDGIAVFNNGFIDKNKKTTSLQNTFYSYLGFFGDGLAPVKVLKKKIYTPITPDDKYGFIDKDLVLRIPDNYDDAGCFSNGFASVKIGKKWGFINKQGEQVVQAAYDEVGDFFSSGLAVVRIGKKYGFVNETGVHVINIVYDWASDFSDGLALVTTCTK